MSDSYKANYVEAGGNLSSKRLKQRLAEAEQRADRDAAAFTAPPNKYVADWIAKALGYLAMGFIAVAVVVGTVLVLTVVPSAEFAAVYEGLNALSSRWYIAALTAVAVFVGYINLSFLKNVFADALPAERPKTSLRHSWYALLAWVGVEGYKNKFDSLSKVELDYVNISSALSNTKTAIMLASLLGRLATLFDKYGDMPLLEAMVHTAKHITATEVFFTAISLWVLWALLKILDAGVLFSYTSFKNSAGALDLAEAKSGSFLEERRRLREQYSNEVLENETLTLNKRKRNKLKQTETPK